MTDDLTTRQRRGLDMADAAPADATDDNLDALLALTRHPESDVRVEAARAIKIIAGADPDLVAARLPAVIGLLHNANLDVRTFGQDILGALGSERPEALEGIAAADPSVIDDRTVERLEAAAERDGLGGRIETAVDAIETARATDDGPGTGATPQTEFCPACGTELDADPAANFCRNCGQEL